MLATFKSKRTRQHALGNAQKYSATCACNIQQSTTCTDNISQSMAVAQKYSATCVCNIQKNAATRSWRSFIQLLFRLQDITIKKLGECPTLRLFAVSWSCHPCFAPCVRGPLQSCFFVLFLFFSLNQSCCLEFQQSSLFQIFFPIAGLSDSTAKPHLF